MKSKIEIDLRLLERAGGGEFDSMFKDSPWTGTMGHVAREYRTLKTTNESLMEKLAMVNEAIIGMKWPVKGLSSQFALDLAESQVNKALTATEATVKEFMAKRDEEKDRELKARARVIDTLIKSEQGFKNEVHKLEATIVGRDRLIASGQNQIDEHKGRTIKAEATLAEEEKEREAEMLRVKACEHIAEDEPGWEKLRNECPSTAAVASLRDAFVKRDKEAMMLREFINKGMPQVVHENTCKWDAHGENFLDPDCIGCVTIEPHHAILSSTAHLGRSPEAK